MTNGTGVQPDHMLALGRAPAAELVELGYRVVLAVDGAVRDAGAALGKDGGIISVAQVDLTTAAGGDELHGMGSTALARGREDAPGDVPRAAIAAITAVRTEVVTGPITSTVRVMATRVLPDPAAPAVATRRTKPGSGIGTAR